MTQIKRTLILITLATSIILAMTNVVYAQTTSKQQMERRARAAAEKSKQTEQTDQKNQTEPKKQTIPEKTDYYLILEKIKDQFNQWQKKGEFEKTTDYEERLKNNSAEQFYQVCGNVLEKYVSDFGYRREEGERGILQPYNADSEYFPVKFSFIQKWIGGYAKEEFFDCIVTVPVPIDDAQEFKQEYSSHNWDVNVYDYVFVNNYLVPSKVVYKTTDRNKNKTSRTFSVPVQNSREVAFAFNNLGLHNPYCSGIVFRMHMLKAAEEEQQKRLAEERERNKQKEPVFKVVEQMPAFPGGNAELSNYLSSNIKYPTIAAENGIEGRVIVTFVVNKDGSLQNIRVTRSLDPSCDKEAIRIVRGMPKWIPGKQNGQVVAVEYTMPVTFKLQK